MKKLFAFALLCSAVAFVGCAEPADTKKAETPAAPAAGTDDKKDDTTPAAEGEAAPAAEGEAAPAAEGDAATPATEGEGDAAPAPADEAKSE